MTKNIYTIGFVLFLITMAIFLGLYFFGMNTDYFNNSLLINAFILPVIYLGGAYVSVNSLRKAGIKMGFRDAFGRAFKPMFIGGLLSIITMFLFLNFADPIAKDLLNFQYIERQKTELEAEYAKASQFVKTPEEKAELDKKYQERKESFAPKMIEGKDMFSFRQFAYYFAAVLVFYIILSTFFASFFRSRTEL
ncbi:hypothetical protein OA84_08485 [Kaistella solincola]|uniref:DUF4199 domain-containing protein n=1 Tax=Kaistella solincola TaxID=510955 RepID=A0ABR4ZSS2_9FLAO|nr:DUF4199 family protein [Kaistella solincola]KIA83533.1 hypothetical protein OA84_08485 [Kaistella solincola]